MTTFNGAAISAIGLSLGIGMWMMGIDCDPKCANSNAELVRLAAIATAAVGVAVIAFSGIKSVFSK